MPDELAVFVSKIDKLPVNLSAPSAFTGDLLKTDIICFSNAHDCAVVKQYLELAHVVRTARPAAVKFGHHGMHTAGVIAQHAANRAMTVRGRVGTENQAVFLQRFLQFVEDQSRLDTRQLLRRVDLDDPIHVFCEIDDHRNIAALTRKARAPATTGDWRAEFSTHGDCDDHVAPVAWNHNADGDLTVIGAVS